jgi:hypothetical protein
MSIITTVRILLLLYCAIVCVLVLADELGILSVILVASVIPGVLVLLYYAIFAPPEDSNQFAEELETSFTELLLGKDKSVEQKVGGGQ